MRIFVSYASEDRAIAESIALALSGAGHDVFFDRESLPPAGNYHGAIKAALDSSQLLVFVLSTHSIARGSYALTEIEYAQDRWPHPADRVVTVRVGDVPWDEIPPYLKAVTILEPTGNVEAEVLLAVNGLASRLAVRPDEDAARAGPMTRPRRRRMSTSLLAALVTAAATVVAALVMVLPNFLPGHPERWTATLEECQVEGRPMRLDAYLKRRETKEVAAEKMKKYTPAQLAYQGRVFSYRVRFIGRPNERYAMYAQMLDAESGEHIPLDETDDEPFATLFQEAIDDTFYDFQWFEPAEVVKDPKRKLLLRLEARNIRQNQPMAHCETPVFTLQ